MTRARRGSGAAAAQAAADAQAAVDDALVPLGLRAGELVRFRRADNDRWRMGTVRRLERDGSLGLTDTKGAARAIDLDLVEVRVTGPRGATRWEPLLDRAARAEQLPLL